MNPVATKLSNFASLTAEEIGALSAFTVRTFDVLDNAPIVDQGGKPDDLFFLLEGMMLRHRDLIEGRRQILSVLLPGNPCDIGVTLFNQRDHSITAAGPCKIARVSDASIEPLSSNYPKIRAALRWATLAAEATAREWIVNIGQRDAVARTAHLFCELFHRNLAIDRAADQTIALPLPQT